MMKPNKTETRNILEPNLTDPTTPKLPGTNVDSPRNQVLLNVVLNRETDVKESTPTGVKNIGSTEGFRYLIKTVSSLAISALDRGDIVNSKILCAEIRYGQHHDTSVDGTDVAGLNKPERLNAGKVIWLLAETGELPLEPLGRNTANLQQYRVK